MTLPEEPLTGFVEGWYGRLLEWPERHRLMQAVASAGMNFWWYAPKEDPAHRFAWREAYAATWRDAFQTFCAKAQTRGVHVAAGLAPGADIDLADLACNADMACLVSKTRAMIDDGVHVPTVLLDDIDPLLSQRLGGFKSEGEAHASLANELGHQLGCSLLVVPRIYANELHAESPAYLPDFIDTLDPGHALSVCGSDVVARHVDIDECRRYLGQSTHRIIVWDNLYANDYCPRRLMMGPWRGRDRVQEFALNPTGMPATDHLLIDIVAAERNKGSVSSQLAWRAVLDRHGVPADFDVVAEFFDAPVFNTPGAVSPDSPYTLSQQLDALETLTWRWKSALGREWFPYFMSLRHDLLLAADQLPEDRIRKTQTAPLARRISASSHTRDS